MVYGEVTWMFVCGIVLSLVVGFGMGANDVGNAFAPSVGAKALTLRQALLVASIFKFTGAVLMGSGVTSTIRSGITNVSFFLDIPSVLAYGFLCSLLATSIWLLIATQWELPVSSTHSIISAIVGMTVVASGWAAVNWATKTDTFPYLKGLGGICLSWVFSPILAGGFSIILFFFIRLIVLRSPNAFQRSLWLLPLFTFATFFVVTYFTIAKAGLQFGWEKTPNSKKAWISAIVGSGTALIAALIGVPFIKKKVEADLAAEAAAAAAQQSPGGKPGKESASGSESGEADEEAATAAAVVQQLQQGHPNATPTRLHTFRNSRLWKGLTHGLNQDIHKDIETNPRVAEIHSAAEVFDRKAETSFKYLRVFTACANSFAHGSNEVANSVGALAAIYQIWQDSAVSSSAPVPTWLLAIGGVGIMLGVLLWGYKIMRVLGVQMAKLTNSRGFTVEICAAAVVILASRFDLPLSTTHAAVGAVASIGLLEGRKAVNGRLFVKCVLGWVFTIVIVAATSAAFTAQGLYAPSRSCSNERADVGAYLNSTSNSMAAMLQMAGQALNNATLVQQGQEHRGADRRPAAAHHLPHPAHGHPAAGTGLPQPVGALCALRRPPSLSSARPA
ncbi:hypothetical protein ABPG75_011307 [Micractinium tetrahymenae]